MIRSASRPPAPSSVRNRIVAGATLALSALAMPLHAQQPEPQWPSGKALYDKVCGYCHKPEVGVGTVLQGRDLPPEYITAIVRNGFNAMPAFPESYVDDASLVALSKYLASLPPVPPPPAAPPANGARP